MLTRVLPLVNRFSPVALILGMWSALWVAGCNQDFQTGIWFQVASPDVAVDEIQLEIWDATRFTNDPAAVQIIKLSDTQYIADVPTEAMWVLVYAGTEVNDRVRIKGTGRSHNRAVAFGTLEDLAFKKDGLIEVDRMLLLEAQGQDLDQDGVLDSADCDDSDPNVYPDADELCDDLDNNCDGSVDDTCECGADGTTQRDCWPQWAREPAEGSPCQKGIQQCLSGRWGLCEGLALPDMTREMCFDGSTDFSCDACHDEVDNDCDGYMDETDPGNPDARDDDRDPGCGGCFTGERRDCYSGEPGTENIGLCHGGIQDCTPEGIWEAICEGEITPEQEECDSYDNDCDGGTDENYYLDVGQYDPDDGPVENGPCGECTAFCQYDQSEQCVSGSCSCGGSGPDCAGTEREYCCGVRCVDLTSDNAHCAACDQVCGENSHCEGSYPCTCDQHWDADVGCYQQWVDHDQDGDCEILLGTLEHCSAHGDSCDDGNICTDDWCDPCSNTCGHAPNELACPDSDPCTVNEHCVDGNCVTDPLDQDGDGFSAGWCGYDDCCDRGDEDSTGCTEALAASINPTAQELRNTASCSDNIDNDCDGLVDLNDPFCGDCNNDGDCTNNNVCDGEETCDRPNATCLNGTSLNCNDGNPCTNDSCDASDGCQHVNNTSSCDDNNPCTIGDTCQSGNCQPGTTERICNDGRRCTTDSCDPNDHDGDPCHFVNNSLSCNDGDACTDGDYCSGGACQSGTAHSCNDSEVCTNDWCDSDDHDGDPCHHSNNENSCDDGNACTLSDTCSGGECQAGLIPKVCNDGNLCTDDHCNPDDHDGDPCYTTYNTVACNDGDACTTGDRCDTGTCVGVGTQVCNDGIDCTTDSCNTTTGCVYNPDHAYCDDDNPCTDDECHTSLDCRNIDNTDPCDDGLYCTLTDTCSSGSCVGAGDRCPGVHCDETRDRCADCLQNDHCDDSNACTTDTCNDGSCENTNNGLPCNDGVYCNGSDTCSGGSCQHAGDPCSSGTECEDHCNESTEDCDDPSGTLCTDDGNACTNDTCDGNGNCTHPDNTASCNDGLYCNGTDTCADGTCDHTGDPCTGGSECADNCDDDTDDCNDPAGTGCTADANQCTDDICDGNGNCTHPDNTANCDDGLYCTGTDTCAGGSCTHAGNPCSGATPVCDDDNNICVGCLVDGDCDDGDYCTGAETCVTGTCNQPGDPCSDPTPVCDEDGDACVECLFDGDCDDGDACTTDTCEISDTCSSVVSVSCEAHELCNPTDGSCECDSANNWDDCTADPGCETNTDSDIDHCGACDNPCANPNGTTSCESGACEPVCDSEWADCDFDPDNGCTDPANQVLSCGGSCTDCTSLVTDWDCVWDSGWRCGCDDNPDCASGDCNTGLLTCKP